MRSLLVLFCLTILASFAQAQIQERSLEDRLLEPSMSLANSAQNKKFAAVEGTSADKKFEAKTFSSATSHTAKSFLGLHDFFAHGFSTKSYTRTEAAEEAKRNADLAFAATESSKKSSLIRKSVYADNSVEGDAYADNHAFLAKGTRQEILDQQNHVKPMTIEQVRELLNTNR